MNPAALSSELASLFPPGAIAAVLREQGDPSLLLPAEAMYVARAVPKRVREFAAGRLCARRALAEFGFVDVAIEVAEDRQPRWPDRMVGSITHTSGFCAAVVARRPAVAALGVDSEAVGDVNAEIWHRICVPIETAWIGSLPASQRAAAAALIFSAKEAFYKCQFPVARQRLNFQDVRVEAPAWDGCGGGFEIHALRSLAIAEYATPPLRGRYLFHQGFVTAGLGLTAAPLQAQ
jgi:4'-phosphopantetheinyl transferase EntD